MKKQVAILVSIFFYYGLFACQCYPVKFKKELEDTPSIVKVKVVSIAYVSGESADSVSPSDIQATSNTKQERISYFQPKTVTRVEVEILRCYKGKPNLERMSIYTSRLGASCGYLDFEEGKEFIVFLRPNENQKNTDKEENMAESSVPLWTNRCSRTSLYKKSMENQILEELKTQSDN